MPSKKKKKPFKIKGTLADAARGARKSGFETDPIMRGLRRIFGKKKKKGG